MTAGSREYEALKTIGSDPRMTVSRHGECLWDSHVLWAVSVFLLGEAVISGLACSAFVLVILLCLLAR